MKFFKYRIKIIFNFIKIILKMFIRASESSRMFILFTYRWIKFIFIFTLSTAKSKHF